MVECSGEMKEAEKEGTILNMVAGEMLRKEALGTAGRTAILYCKHHGQRP